MTNQLALRTNEIDIVSLGDVLVKSGYFSDAKDASQAIVKVLAGRELGFGPIASMSGVHIVQGKPAIGATLLASAIKRHPSYNYRIVEHTDEACEVAFFEDGQECGRSRFTMTDAKNAGLTGKDIWRKYPRNMLFSRVISNGARWYCPDVFGGPVYTPEEMGADVDGETGEIISIEVTQPAPRPDPQPQRAAEIIEELGYTEPPPKTNGASWNPVAILVDAKICDNNHAASGLINKHVPKDILSAHDVDGLLVWGHRYRGWRNAGAEIDAAVENATNGVAIEDV